MILGFAFKANTNDTRESAAITICKNLIDEGAYLVIHDPKVKANQIEKDLQIKQILEEQNKKETGLKNQIGKWQFSKSLNIFNDAHAILVLTEWEEYKYIDWHKAVQKMVKPSWVFDSRSIINAKVQEAGINLWRLGDGSQNNEISNFSFVLLYLSSNLLISSSPDNFHFGSINIRGDLVGLDSLCFAPKGI